jgi:hypothetical protein
MSYSVAQLKSSLSAIFHGTNLDQVQGLNDCIERSANQLLLDIDPQETKRTVPFSTPIFNSVYDYACPPDLKGNRIIDIKPQANRTTSDFLPQEFNRSFDMTKGLQSQEFTIGYNNMIRTIRINMPQLVSGMQIGSIYQGNTPLSSLNFIQNNDGNWRQVVVGANLEIQKNESGVWVTIQTITP